MSDITTITVTNVEGETLNPVTATITVIGTVPAGPPGAPGDAGAPGEDGASAYEVAVAEGFVGDEAAWLASLVGEQGEPGDPGTPGADGEGVPTGGTAGQVLTKDSGTDFDTSWQDPTGGGGSGVVETVVAGTNIDVDSTDPANPVVSVEALTAGDISGLSTVATTGAYSDLSGKPSLGTAAATASSDYATAAQGATADSAVQPGDLAAVATSGDYDDLIDKPSIPSIAGLVNTANSPAAGEWAKFTDADTIEGRTPAELKADLDLEAGTDFLSPAAIAAAYQPLDGDLTALATAGNSAVLAATTASFTTADETKLDGIEAGADVTDATNVAAAGAVMDTGNETVAGIKTFSSSPIVPTPTTDFQVATKKYVDDNAGGSSDPFYMFGPDHTPDAIDDEFDDGTLTGFTTVAPTGTVTWTEARHGVTATATVDVASGDLSCILKAGTIAVGECVETMIQMLGPVANSTGALLLLTDGTATSSVPVGVGLYLPGTGSAGLWTVNGGTLTAYSGSVIVNAFPLMSMPTKIRIRRSASTTYVPEVSIDGANWTSLDAVSLTSSTTHTHVGFGFTNVAGTNSGLARFEYLRKYTA